MVRFSTRILERVWLVLSFQDRQYSTLHITLVVGPVDIVVSFLSERQSALLLFRPGVAGFYWPDFPQI